jgi:hypothetical protein
VQVFVPFVSVVADGTTVVCVQPQESPVTVRGRAGNRRLRLWLALGLGTLLLLCLGGVGVFISLYDNATKIQRTDPDAVVDSYLGAYLQDRDDKAAALYTCKSGATLQPIVDLRNQLVAREHANGTKVNVSWEGLQVTGTGDVRTVQTVLTISGMSNGQAVSSHQETWDFRLVDQSGWRVCGATKVP